jgi:hypothetical protein
MDLRHRIWHTLLILALVAGQWQLVAHDHEAHESEAECELCLHAPALEPAPSPAPVALGHLPSTRLSLAALAEPIPSLSTRGPRARGPPVHPPA